MTSKKQYRKKQLLKIRFFSTSVYVHCWKHFLNGCFWETSLMGQFCHLLIWWQIWGETRGRCEGLPAGKVSTRHKEQVSNLIFPHFLTMNRYQNLDFSALIFQGWALPKILETWIYPRFLGMYKDGLTKNLSKLGLFCSFLGILKGQTHPKN